MWIIQLISKADPVLVARFPKARVLQGNRYLFVTENPDSIDEVDGLPEEVNQVAFDAQLNGQSPNGNHIRLSKGQASQFAPHPITEE